MGSYSNPVVTNLFVVLNLVISLNTTFAAKSGAKPTDCASPQ